MNIKRAAEGMGVVLSTVGPFAAAWWGGTAASAAIFSGTGYGAFCATLGHGLSVVCPITAAAGGTLLLVTDVADLTKNHPTIGKVHKVTAIVFDLLMMAGGAMGIAGFFTANPILLGVGVGVAIIATLARAVLGLRAAVKTREAQERL